MQNEELVYGSGQNQYVWTHCFFLAQRIAILFIQQSILDRLVEPKHSASYSYASDLAACQIVSVRIEYDGFIIIDLGWIAHPWWDFNPRYFNYIPNSINNRHVSDHQRTTSQIYLYISNSKFKFKIYQGLQTKKLYTKMTKIWFADVKWQPFWIWRFVGKRCHLQLGIRQKWIQHKNSYRNNKWSTFPKKCLQVFI